MDYFELTAEEAEISRFIEEKLGPVASSDYSYPRIHDKETAKRFVIFHRVKMILDINPADLTPEQLEKIVSLGLTEFSILTGQVKSRVSVQALREELEELTDISAAQTKASLIKASLGTRAQPEALKKLTSG